MDGSARPVLGRRGVLRAGGLAGLGVTALALPPALAAASPGSDVELDPLEGATQVEVGTQSLFDAWTQQYGVTVTQQDPTNAICWQVFFAHRDLVIEASTEAAYGIATYEPGNNNFTWHVAVSTVPGIEGQFGEPFVVAEQSAVAYVAGGLITTTSTARLAVPSGHYFLLGSVRGPFYRAFRSLAEPRTAMRGGVAQVTAVNRVYYGAHASQFDPAQLPQQLGGPGTFFSELEWFVTVMSLRLP
jgi:hypothetical protein